MNKTLQPGSFKIKPKRVHEKLVKISVIVLLLATDGGDLVVSYVTPGMKNREIELYESRGIPKGRVICDEQ